VSPLIDELFKVIVELKWNENTLTKCKLILNRDEALERQLVMDSK